ncbi:MAG TPA: four helix bundle protein [Terriglobales bacterium]|nr:four helix bundle protein [Terriglobales bacterium]
MASRPEDLRERTKKFALRVIRLFRALPRSGDAQVIGKQLLRSGTSVAANYRAACRARSRPEFAARIGIVMEEADETVFWLELTSESEIVPLARLKGLLQESRELAAIFTASYGTAHSKKSITRLPDYPITQS